jgi:hypothetical protein
MQPADLEEFTKVMNGMAAMRKATLIPEVLDLWWACMANWAIGEFKVAAIEVLKTTDFMPTPKDFEDLRKAGRPTPGEAWIEARRHLVWGLHGYTLHQDCPPLIARTVRAIGGANVIGMCDENKIPFLEKRFCEHYEAMGDSDWVRQTLPQIAEPDWLTLQHLVLKRIGK